MTRAAIQAFAKQPRTRQRLLAGLVRVSLEREGSEAVIVERVDQLLAELATHGLTRLADVNAAVGDLKPAGQAVAAEQLHQVNAWLDGLDGQLSDVIDTLEEAAGGVLGDPAAFVEDYLLNEEEAGEAFGDVAPEVVTLTEAIEPLLTHSALKQLTGGERVEGLLAAAKARREVGAGEFAGLKASAFSGGSQIDALLKDAEKRRQAERVHITPPDERKRLKELGDIAGQLLKIATERRATGASAIDQPTVVPAKAAAPTVKKAVPPPAKAAVAAPPAPAKKAAPAPAKKPAARGKKTPEPEPAPAPAKKAASKKPAAAAKKPAAKKK